MFERYTDRARKVLVLTQDESRNLGHGFLGTEHLLLGLIAEKEGVAAQVLHNLSIDLEPAREAVKTILGPTHVLPVPPSNAPLTPRAKKVLELALREALQMGCNYIGTEHLLLGLVREGDGVGCQVIESFGVPLFDMRREVIALLVGHQKAQPPPEPRSLVLPAGDALNDALEAYFNSTRSSLVGQAFEWPESKDKCITAYRELIEAIGRPDYRSVGWLTGKP